MEYITGSTEVSVDTYGRLIVPSKYKSFVENNNITHLVLFHHLIEKALHLWPRDKCNQWLGMLNKEIEQGASTEKVEFCESVRQKYFSSAEEFEITSLNRISVQISELQRRFMHLGSEDPAAKKVILEAVGDSFNVWSVEEYNSNIEASRVKVRGAVDSGQINSNLYSFITKYSKER